MKSLNDLINFCNEKLKEKNLDDKPHKKRLMWEIGEIKGKEKWDYFINLYKTNKKYSKNKNNLLVPYLLDIVDEFNINQDPNYVMGDSPDVDIDFLKEVRDYIKNVYLPKEYGSNFVCNIGSYGTFGIKGSLLDSARVHGLDHKEIQSLTKNIELKDDEGKAITWESVMRLYPELKEWCERNETNKAVADFAHRLHGRNRNMGVHAGGVIISSVPLDEFIPLLKNEEEPQASAWTEGLHEQDLQPVGLIKIDCLVINTLRQIYEISKLVKQRHGLDSICALEGQGDWSDIDAWRNDQKSLEMANKGDLKCVFQFDSAGIRKLAKSGGVTRFEDLAAYSSLYRPGPMLGGMHNKYVERKKGREKYETHPLLKPILDKTYGVLCFQEQIMQVLNVAAAFPLKECYNICKAISKKKLSGFIKYKEKFLENSVRILNITPEAALAFWNQIEVFSEYAFNKSHTVSYTYNSMILLYLKCHYPAEFYTALMSKENDTDKIREYKIEAKMHGIDINPLHINKSKDVISFSDDDKIYMGFSNIKGIGKEVAKRIVENQPYSSFKDFLERFGCDMSAAKAVISLNLFNYSPTRLWEYYEYYKNRKKNLKEKEAKNTEKKTKYEEQIKLLSGVSVDLNNFNLDEFKHLDAFSILKVSKRVKCNEEEAEEKEKFIGSIEGEEVEYYKYYKTKIVDKKYNKYKEIEKIYNKWVKSDEANILNIKEGIIDLENFEFTGEIDEDIRKIITNKVLAEETFYGFQWEHELHSIVKDREIFNFSDVLDENKVGPVDIKVIKMECRKGPKKTFWRLTGEDSYSSIGYITVWENDYERWKEEFSVGNLIRIRLKPPFGGYPTYTFDSLPSLNKFKYDNRHSLKKEDDYRVMVWKSHLAPHAEILKDE